MLRALTEITGSDFKLIRARPKLNSSSRPLGQARLTAFPLPPHRLSRQQGVIMKLPLIAAIIFVALYSLLATAWISYTHLVSEYTL